MPSFVRPEEYFSGGSFDEDDTQKLSLFGEVSTGYGEFYTSFFTAFRDKHFGSEANRERRNELARELLVKRTGGLLTAKQLTDLAWAGIDYDSGYEFNLPPDTQFVALSSNAAELLAHALELNGENRFSFKRATAHFRKDAPEGTLQIDIGEDELQRRLAALGQATNGTAAESLSTETNGKVKVTYLHRKIEPEENPFLKQLSVVNAERVKHHAKPITVEMVASAVSVALNKEVDAWSLLGYAPLSDKVTADEVVNTAVPLLFNDASPKVASEEEMAGFLKAIPGIDMLSGQDKARKSPSGLLRLLSQQHGLDTKGLWLAVAHATNNQNPPSQTTVSSWLRGNLPQARMQDLLFKNVFHLPQTESDLYRDAIAQERQGSQVQKTITTLLQSKSDVACAEIITAALGDISEVQKERIAYRLGIYTSSINAYRNGSAIPSADIIDRMVGHWGLTDEQSAVFQAARLQDLKRQYDMNPQQASRAEVLGAATKETVLQDILHEWLEPHLTKGSEKPPFTYGLIEENSTAKGIPLSQDSLKKLCSIEPTASYKHSARTTSKLKAGFACDESQSLLLQDIACRNLPKRPFGEMLEEYVKIGGNNFKEFCRIYRQKHKLSIAQFAEISGLSDFTIQKWDRVESANIGSRTPILLAQRFELTPYQQSLLQRLARGEKDAGTVEDIIQDAKDELNALSWQDREARAAVAGGAFDKIVERSGLDEKHHINCPDTENMESSRVKGRGGVFSDFIEPAMIAYGIPEECKPSFREQFCIERAMTGKAARKFGGGNGGTSSKKQLIQKWEGRLRDLNDSDEGFPGRPL